MTSQTKHFIELSDIVGFRIECENERCRASVCIGMDKALRTSSLRACPYCNEPWAQLPEGSNIEPTIQKFVDGMVSFQDILRRRKEILGDKGFSIMLEIKPDKPITPSTSQKSETEKPK